MMDTKFKVIIAGGGPSGLTAAHSLHLAGIDFVVLEQRDTVIEDLGASLVLAAPSLRVMHQFGLLNELLAVGEEITHARSFTIEGRTIKDSDKVKLLHQNHGCGPVAFHRAHLVQILYDRLPLEAKKKFEFGKKLIDIESTEDGVKAICADGSIYEGSIILGADGVHSKTRLMMRHLALKSDPSRPWDPEAPFPASYKCLWASFPRPSQEKGQNHDTQHHDQSVMYITGRERGWIFLYKKLSCSTTDRISYSPQDMVAFAKEFEHFPVTKSLTVKDVWGKRMTAGMANLEEGVLDHWSWGRVALVGDACHKFTPNAGLGLNNGIQDVVMLCNGIREAVCHDSPRQPSTPTLAKIFFTYQSVRTSMLQADASISAGMTRMQAWATRSHYLLSRYIMSLSLVEQFLIGVLGARATRQALVLDYVPGDEPLNGRVPWMHPIPSSVERA